MNFYQLTHSFLLSFCVRGHTHAHEQLNTAQAQHTHRRTCWTEIAFHVQSTLKTDSFFFVCLSCTRLPWCRTDSLTNTSLRFEPSLFLTGKSDTPTCECVYHGDTWPPRGKGKRVWRYILYWERSSHPSSGGEGRKVTVPRGAQLAHPSRPFSSVYMRGGHHIFCYSFFVNWRGLL